MRLLHVHSGNMFGGVERMLEAMSPAWAGTEPVASRFALCFEGDVKDRLEAAGATVDVLGPVQVRRPDRLLSARHRLRSLVAREPFDAAMVHSAWGHALFGRTVVDAGLPLIRWIHAPGPGPSWLEHWSRRVRPDLLLCNSQYTRSAVHLPWPDVAVDVHYPPARPSAADTTARAEMRRALETSPETRVIAMASRLEGWKGHRLLIDALARLAATEWAAWIVGGAQHPSEASYFEELKARVAALGLSDRVTFLGQRADVERVLAAADLYCQPNQGPEPFGLSIVEALSAGLPVVATRLGAFPEIVTDACGVLVDPGSVQGIAGALDELLRDADRRLAMGEAARRRALVFCDLPESLRRLARTLAGAGVASPALLVS